MSKIVTNEIFQKEIKDLINPDLKLLGSYIDSQTKIPCKCKICEHEWEMLPGNIKKGKGCPICGKKKSAQSRNNQAKLKNLEKLKEISQKKNYIITSDYIDAKTKIHCKCNICNHEWDSLPGNLIKGQGCPNCKRKTIGDKLRLPLNIAEKYLDKNIIILQYGSPTKFKCEVCGYEWEIQKFSSEYKNIIKCPHCSGRIILQEDFLEKIKIILPDVEILENYSKATNKIKCKCKKCGKIFFKDPHHLYRGQGCPDCTKSKGENNIVKYLDSLNINYITQYYITIDKEINSSGKAYVDFYLPDYNLFIEYNGIQHYIPIKYFGGELKFEKQKLRDQYIRDYCNKNNVNLLEISYNDDLVKVLDDYFKI